MHNGGLFMRYAIFTLMIAALFTPSLNAEEYHVSETGDDDGNGSVAIPFRTISTAAQFAEPGDEIIVHEGVYRESINPPRGGDSDSNRIVYRAAEDEEVIIKGSEVVSGWTSQGNGVWKITLANSFFGDYNPYKDVISGDWFHRQERDHHTGEVYLNGEALYEVVSSDSLITDTSRNWYCESDDVSTTILAYFGDADPNNELTEINVRPICFYPEKTGLNYITVSGFIMRHAATQWAAPTAEQVALIGTNWSKGWIIENNIISDSKCVGITLGKDRASGNNGLESADGYNIVVDRIMKRGDWTKETIGSHIIRNNTIHDCGAAGICGSLGAVFSEISGNHIYNIYQNKPFFGYEIAGIKFHASIDCVITGNRIHDAYRGIWLDWMTQGTRISNNLLYNNEEDFFAEVNHGPYLVDNNIFLSPRGITTWSNGGAYVHNLVDGLNLRRGEERTTPYHKAHSTQVDGIKKIEGGDERFMSNIFSHAPEEDKPVTLFEAELPIFVEGNVYLNGSVHYEKEQNFIEDKGFNPTIKCVEDGDNVFLHMSLPSLKNKLQTVLVTTESLGKPLVPALPYENPDGTAITVDTDYFGKKRDMNNPAPGPFENPGEGEIVVKVW